jgi:hypothetical protein
MRAPTHRYRVLASGAAAVVTVLAGVVFAPTASAATSGPTYPLARGTYNCYDIDNWIDTLIYSGTSVRLGGRNTYVAGERHVSIDNPVPGKYRFSGGKIIFQSGPLKGYYGKIHPSDPYYGAPYFSLYLAKTRTSISRICIHM